MKYLIFTVAIALAGCSTQKGNDRMAQHGADQIRIVAVQRQAMVDQAKAEAATQTALVEALARVAEANPDHAPSVSVALAVIGVRASEGLGGGNSQVVSLQQPQNEALEWAKALSPAVGGLVTGLGIAAINADLAKQQSDNNRDILLGDQATDAQIVSAVAAVGTAAASKTGIAVGGDYMIVSDQGSVDQSVNTTNTTTTTTTNTETNTSATDSYNPSYDYSVNDDNSVVTFGGSEMTLSELLAYLNTSGAPFSLTLGDGTTYTGGSGDGEETKINCDGVLFGPHPPECQ